MKRRLGLGQNETLPSEIQGLVDSAAREVVGNSIATALGREVTSLRPPSFNEDGRSTEARTSSELALVEEAEHLAAKKRALQVAGFSNDEAMRILVAEVTGRASQIRG